MEAEFRVTGDATSDRAIDQLLHHIMLASDDTVLHCTVPHYLSDGETLRCDHVARLVEATEDIVV